jgi:hypothetical protein
MNSKRAATAIIARIIYFEYEVGEAVTVAVVCIGGDGGIVVVGVVGAVVGGGVVGAVVRGGIVGAVVGGGVVGAVTNVRGGGSTNSVVST